MTLNDRIKTRTFAAIAMSNLFCLSAAPVLANHQNQDLRINRGEARLSRQERLDARLPKVERFNVANMVNILPPVQKVNLDLSSNSANIVLEQKLFRNLNSISIDVGGQLKTLASGSSVTPAEYVAARQVLANGNQSLRLDDQGVATGGSFVLNSLISNRVSGLVVPTAVTGFDYFSSDRNINIGGDLVNNGTIYGVTTSKRVTEGVINARGDINNNAGAIISTQLANSIHGVFDGQDLTLQAGNSLNNSGRIVSSGNLTLIANTLVNNQSSPDQTSSVSAARNLNLQSYSGNIFNNAQMTAVRGDINISSLSLSQDLNIHAQNGTFSAKNGDINLRDSLYTGAGNTTLDGGNYLSQNLNIYSGTGAIEASVDKVSGKLNSSAQIEHFIAATDVLKLGTNCILGDPTFANTAGDIIINGGVTASESIAIIASGSITASGNAFISTANSTGASGVPQTAITMIAGGTVTTDGSTTNTIPGTAIGVGKTVTVDLTKGKGGNIDLTGSTHVGTIIDTTSTLTNGGNRQANGGNVNLAAYSASSKTGNILLPENQTSINTTSSNGNAGAVTIIAGSSSTKTPAIQVGEILTLGGGNDGIVTISSAQPSAAVGPTITFDSSGNASSGIAASPAKGLGSIRVNNIDAGIAQVSISTGGKGAITQGTGQVSGGAIELTSGSGGIGLDSTTAIKFSASDTLKIFSTGNAFLASDGQVDLLGSEAGSKSIFELSTTPDGSGNGRITLNGDLTAGTVNLDSSQAASGQGGIRTNGGTIIATNVNLSDSKGDGISSIGAQLARVFVQTSNLTANTKSDVYIQNTGPVKLGASSAGNGRVFDLINVADADGDGSITLNGDIKSKTGTIGTISLRSDEVVSKKGAGGIIHVGGTLTASNVILSDQTPGIGNGNFGSSKSSILTQANSLTVNTAGSVFINNTGSVTLQSSSAGAGKEFNLKTTADGAGNGAIALTEIKAASGTIDSININSTESGAGTGGITHNGATLAADTITFTDGLNGLGTGNIGVNANRIITTTANLSANTTGFVSIVNSGAVALGASSAGDGKEFNIIVNPDANGNGSITLTKGIKSASGLIGTISLNSNESSTGIGGINGGKSILFANSVNLSDGFGGGSGSIGTTKAAIQLSGVTSITANTLASVNINNVAAANVNLMGSQAINGSFKLTSAGNITTSTIIAGTGIELATTAKNGGITVGGSLVTITPGRTISLKGAGTGSVTQLFTSGDAIQSEFLEIDLDTGTVGTGSNALRTVTKNLTLAGTGLVNVSNGMDLNLGASKTTSSFTLFNSGELRVNGAITSATAIDLTTSSGNLLINANLGSTKATSTVSLETGGSGNITPLSSKILVAANTSVDVRSGGSVGSGSGTATALTVSTPSISATTIGSGIINMNDTSKLDTTLSSSSAGSGFTLNAAGSLTVNNLFINTGNINLFSSGALLKTNGGAILQVGGPGAGQKGTTGGITLANLNTSKGNIEIGTASSIATYVVSPGPTNGQINIVIGTVPVAPIVGAPPATGVTVINNSGGTAFFGTNGIAAVGSGSTINLNGANVVFNTGKLDATHIRLDGAVTITADPPPAPQIEKTTLAKFETKSFSTRRQNSVSSIPLSSDWISVIPTLTGRQRLRIDNASQSSH